MSSHDSEEKKAEDQNCNCNGIDSNISKDETTQTVGENADATNHKDVIQNVESQCVILNDDIAIQIIAAAPEVAMEPAKIEEFVINHIVDTGEEGGIEIDFTNKHYNVVNIDKSEECIVMHSSVEQDDAYKTPSENVLETLSETIYEQIDELIAKLESKVEIDELDASNQNI